MKKTISNQETQQKSVLIRFAAACPGHDPTSALITDKGHSVQARAAGGLGAMKSEKAIDLLIKALKDEACFI